MVADTLSASPLASKFPLLRIEQVTKRFGSVTAVDGLSLEIAAGEFFALLGPSGCGKTTLLRMLAGFETPDEGRILLDDSDIAQVLPHQRPVNMMFQNYALFPHLNVADNIAFGLKRAGLPKAEIADRVAEMATLVRLGELLKRKPDQLSGGQRQRVALARALARRPRLLLLDEPLAALDKKLRESTQRELMDVQRRLGMTFILVTHDQEEAMTMADRIGVMDRGRLAQVSTPRQLYEAPASRWVAEFVGDINILDGEIATREAGRITVATKHAGTIVVPNTEQTSLSVQAVCIAVRPEKVRLSRPDAATESRAAHVNRFEGALTAINYLGGVSRYAVKLDSGATLHVALANIARREGDDYATGDRVSVWFSPDDAMVLAS